MQPWAEKLHHMFRNITLLSLSGNWQMVRTFWLSFTIKSLNDRGNFRPPSSLSCHCFSEICPLYITWGSVNILPASHFMTVRAMCRNCCSMCPRCDSQWKSIYRMEHVILIASMFLLPFKFLMLSHIPLKDYHMSFLCTLWHVFQNERRKKIPASANKITYQKWETDKRADSVWSGVGEWFR